MTKTAATLTFVLVSLVVAGCAASSRQRYGSSANHDPKYRAWTAEGEKHAWVLRSPLSNCALRCRADVVTWGQINADRSRGANLKASAAVNAAAITFPLALPGFILVAPTVGVSLLFGDSPAAKHRAAGDAAVARHALDEAAQAYLEAVIRGDVWALELLAQVWVQQGRLADAVQARRTLQCHAPNLPDQEWTRIETWLGQQQPVPLPCQDTSHEPVEMPWLD